MLCFCEINTDLDAKIYHFEAEKLHIIYIIRKYYVQFFRVQFGIGKDENSVKKWSQTPVNTGLDAKSDPLHDPYIPLYQVCPDLYGISTRFQKKVAGSLTLLAWICSNTCGICSFRCLHNPSLVLSDK